MNVDLNALALNDIVYNNNYIFKVHTNEVKEVKEVKSTPVHTSSTNNCQYKTTINDEWKKWVQRQLQNNTNKNTNEYNYFYFKCFISNYFIIAYFVSII